MMLYFWTEACVLFIVLLVLCRTAWIQKTRRNRFIYKRYGWYKLLLGG